MKRLALTALLLVLGVPLTGCAGSGGTHPTTGESSKPQVPESGSPLVVAVGRKHAPINLLHGARFHSPTRLAIVTAGSGSCPSVPKRLVVQSPHAIQIYLVVKTPPSGTCLTNLVPTPIVVAIDPKQIDVHHRLAIRLYYPKGTVRKYERPVVLTAPSL
jgi:hypothetical protein